jgi:hypothetical protein
VKEKSITYLRLVSSNVLIDNIANHLGQFHEEKQDKKYSQHGTILTVQKPMENIVNFQKLSQKNLDKLHIRLKTLYLGHQKS